MNFQKLLLWVIERRVKAKNSSHLNCLSSCFSSSESSKLGSLPHMKAALHRHRPTGKFIHLFIHLTKFLVRLPLAYFLIKDSYLVLLHKLKISLLCNSASLLVFLNNSVLVPSLDKPLSWRQLHPCISVLLFNYNDWTSQ